MATNVRNMSLPQQVTSTGCDDPVDLGPFLQNYVHKNPFGEHLLGGGIPSSVPCSAAVSYCSSKSSTYDPSSGDRQQRDMSERYKTGYSQRVERSELSETSGVGREGLPRQQTGERRNGRVVRADRSIKSKAPEKHQASKTLASGLLKKKKVSVYSKSVVKMWLAKTLKHRLRSSCRMRRSEVYDITKPMFPYLSVADIHQCILDLFPNVIVTSRAGRIYYQDLICKPEIFSGESEQLRAACERVLSYQLTARQAAVRFSLSISSVLNAVAWYRAEQELLVSSLSNQQNTVNSSSPAEDDDEVYDVDECDDKFDTMIRGEETGRVSSLRSSATNVTCDSDVPSSGGNNITSNSGDLFIVCSDRRATRHKTSTGRNKSPISIALPAKRMMDHHQQSIAKRSRFDKSPSLRVPATSDVGTAASLQEDAVSEFSAENGLASHNRDRKCLQRLRLCNLIQQLHSAGSFSPVRSSHQSNDQNHHRDLRSDCQTTATSIDDDDDGVDLEKMLQEAPCSLLQEAPCSFTARDELQIEKDERNYCSAKLVKIAPSIASTLCYSMPNHLSPVSVSSDRHLNSVVNSNVRNGLHRNEMSSSEVLTTEYSCNQNTYRSSASLRLSSSSSKTVEPISCSDDTSQIHETIVICPESPAAEVSHNATATHRRDREIDVSHRRDREIDVSHCRDREIDVSHRIDREIDVSHCRDREIDVSHCRDREIGVSHSPSREMDRSLITRDAIYTSALTSDHTNVSHVWTNGYSRHLDENIVLSSNERVEKICKREKSVSNHRLDSQPITSFGCRSAVGQVTEENSLELTKKVIKSEPLSTGCGSEASNASTAVTLCRPDSSNCLPLALDKFAGHSNVYEGSDSISDRDQLEVLLRVSNQRNNALEHERSKLCIDKQTLQENLRKSERSLVKLSTAFFQLQEQFQQVFVQLQTAVSEIQNCSRMFYTSEENHSQSILDVPACRPLQ